MTKISLSENSFQINNIDLAFPIEIEMLITALGSCQHHAKTQRGHNHIYTWHKLGLWAYSENGSLVEAIAVGIGSSADPFSPEKNFSGDLLFNGEDAITYYNANKGKRIRLSKGGEAQCIVLNGVTYFFSVQDGKIETVSISAYSAPPGPPTPLEIDEPFRHYAALWQAWIAETKGAISENNRFDNLTHGITEKDITDHKSAGCFDMPLALLNFYKLHNVYYDGVTSAYSFSTNGWQYDLIPFERIRDHWEPIQGIDDDDDDPPDTGDCSEKIISIGYSNPGWIPFAEGRNGDYLLFDTDPSDSGIFGQIVELENESWNRNVVADSLAQLLQNEIDLIKAGNKDFGIILDES